MSFWEKSMSCFRRALIFRRALTLAFVAAVALAAGYGDSAGAKKPKPKFQIKFATLAPDGSTCIKTMHAIYYAGRRRT